MVAHRAFLSLTKAALGQILSEQLTSAHTVMKPQSQISVRITDYNFCQ
jgi:hypothetical protein